MAGPALSAVLPQTNLQGDADAFFGAGRQRHEHWHGVELLGLGENLWRKTPCLRDVDEAGWPAASSQLPEDPCHAWRSLSAA